MNKYAAYELFKPMRHSTPKEQQLYKQMLDKYAIPIEGVNIFNMSNEIEIDYCDICHKKTQVSRKYYHYNIACECCGSTHFEIVRYCKNCTPRPPYRISAIVEPYDN